MLYDLILLLTEIRVNNDVMLLTYKSQTIDNVLANVFVIR